MRLSETATGRPQIVISESVDYDSFEQHALAFVERHDMTILQKIDCADERMWIVEYRGQQLCISWDGWLCELTVMAWGETPDDTVRALYEED